MDKIRSLAKPVDADKLHREIAARSALFTGLVVIGDVLHVSNADDLIEIQLDEILAAHTLPTADEVTHAAAQRDAAVTAVKVLVFWVLRRLLGRNPTAAEIQAARDEIISLWKALD